jgi:hypothetical protein
MNELGLGSERAPAASAVAAVALAVTVVVLALVAAAGAGCGVGDPRACSVTCGAAGECPDGTSCGADLYCYRPDEVQGSCLAGPPDSGDGTTIDASVAEPDAAIRPDAGRPGFAGESAPNLAIPDDSPLGIDTSIDADTPGLEIETVQVHLEIAHTWRGDLVLTLSSPAGEIATVVEIPSDDLDDDVRGTFDVVGFTPGTGGTGPWTLHLVDRGPNDFGILEYWSIGINQPAL